MDATVKDILKKIRQQQKDNPLFATPLQDVAGRALRQPAAPPVIQQAPERGIQTPQFAGDVIQNRLFGQPLVAPGSLRTPGDSTMPEMGAPPPTKSNEVTRLESLYDLLQQPPHKETDIQKKERVAKLHAISNALGGLGGFAAAWGNVAPVAPDRSSVHRLTQEAEQMRLDNENAIRTNALFELQQIIAESKSEKEFQRRVDELDTKQRHALDMQKNLFEHQAEQGEKRRETQIQIAEQGQPQWGQRAAFQKSINEHKFELDMERDAARAASLNYRQDRRLAKGDEFVTFYDHDNQSSTALTEAEAFALHKEMVDDEAFLNWLQKERGEGRVREFVGSTTGSVIKERLYMYWQYSDKAKAFIKSKADKKSTPAGGNKPSEVDPSDPTGLRDFID